MICNNDKISMMPLFLKSVCVFVGNTHSIYLVAAFVVITLVAALIFIHFKRKTTGRPTNRNCMYFLHFETPLCTKETS